METENSSSEKGNSRKAEPDNIGIKPEAAGTGPKHTSFKPADTKPAALNPGKLKKTNTSPEFMEALNTFYADKTMMLKAVIDSEARNFLFAAPPGFGKTLMLSMIHTFFEDTGKDIMPVFKNMDIGKYGGAKYLNEAGKYPVVHLDLAPLKNCISKEETGVTLKKIIIEEMSRFPMELDLSKIPLREMLSVISRHIKLYYGVNPVLLIDNYDSPLHNKAILLKSALVTEPEDIAMLPFYPLIGFLASALNEKGYKFVIMAGRIILTGRMEKDSFDPGSIRFITLGEKSFGSAFGFGKRELQHFIKNCTAGISSADTNVIPHLTDIFAHSAEAYERNEKGENGYLNPGEFLSWVENGFGKIPREWDMMETEAMARQIFRFPLRERMKLYALIMGKSIRLPGSRSFSENGHKTQEKLIPALIACGYLRPERKENADGDFIDMAMPYRHSHFFFMLMYHKQIARSTKERQMFKDLYNSICAIDEKKASEILSEIYAKNNGTGIGHNRKGEFAEIIALSMAVHAGKQYTLRELLPEEGGRQTKYVESSWPEFVLEPAHCSDENPLIVMSVSETNKNPESIAEENIERLKAQEYNEKFFSIVYAGAAAGDNGCCIKISAVRADGSANMLKFL